MKKLPTSSVIFALVIMILTAGRSVSDEGQLRHRFADPRAIAPFVEMTDRKQLNYVLFDSLPRQTAASIREYDDGPRLIAAAQKVCNNTGGSGGVIHFGAGEFFFGRTNSLFNSCPIRMVGEVPSEVPFLGGTWFHINSAANTPFSVNASGSPTPLGVVAGFTFENIGIYQDQPKPAGGLYPAVQPLVTGYSPNVYPPVFAFGAAGKVLLRNIRAYPVYALVISTNSGRLEIDDIDLQCLSYCFDLDQMFDVVHLTGYVHHNDFWSTNANIIDFQYKHSDLFKIGRVDGMDGGNIFALGMRSIFSFHQGISRGADDYASRWGIGHVYADAVYQAIQGLEASGSTTQTFPEYIHIDSLHVSCLAPGSTQGARGSAAIYVGPEGAIDLSVGSLTVTKCGAGSNDAAISLNNSKLPSTIQIGTVDVSYQGSTLGPFGPVVSAAKPQGASSYSKVIFASPPTLASNGQLLLANRQFLHFGTTQIPALEVKLANKATINAAWLYETYILEVSAHPVAASTFLLPPNPWEGERVQLLSAGSISNLMVASVDGSAIREGKDISLEKGQAVSYVYSTSLNEWLKRKGE